MFIHPADAREFIANHDFATLELRAFTECEDVVVERDGHCGFAHNGNVHFLSNDDLIKFANHLREV